MILIQKRIESARKFNLSKIAAKATLSALILLAVLLTNSSEAHIDKVSLAIKSVKIDTTNSWIFVSTKPQVQIVVGESLVDKQAREKAEAEAKTKALAIAQAPREVVARAGRSYNQAEVNLKQLYASAAAAYGLPDGVRTLEAVHYIESGRSLGGAKTSYAGAEGPMQFLPSTWRHWGADGDGDGVKDINNVYDAVYGAARYLATSGGAGEGHYDLTRALLAYNHSQPYVRKVISVINSIPQ